MLNVFSGVIFWQQQYWLCLFLETMVYNITSCSRGITWNAFQSTAKMYSLKVLWYITVASFLCPTYARSSVCCFPFLKFCCGFMFLPPNSNFCATEDLISYCTCGENEKSMKTHQKIQCLTNIIIILVVLVLPDSYRKSHKRACSPWKQFKDCISIYTA